MQLLTYYSEVQNSNYVKRIIYTIEKVQFKLLIYNIKQALSQYLHSL